MKVNIFLSYVSYQMYLTWSSVTFYFDEQEKPWIFLKIFQKKIKNFKAILRRSRLFKSNNFLRGGRGGRRFFKPLPPNDVGAATTLNNELDIPRIMASKGKCVGVLYCHIYHALPHCPYSMVLLNFKVNSGLKQCKLNIGENQHGQLT